MKFYTFCVSGLLTTIPEMVSSAQQSVYLKLLTRRSSLNKAIDENSRLTSKQAIIGTLLRPCWIVSKQSEQICDIASSFDR